jgi:hypothetical protein
MTPFEITNAWFVSVAAPVPSMIRTFVKTSWGSRMLIYRLGPSSDACCAVVIRASAVSDATISGATKKDRRRLAIIMLHLGELGRSPF